MSASSTATEFGFVAIAAAAGGAIDIATAAVRGIVVLIGPTVFPVYGGARHMERRGGDPPSHIAAPRLANVDKNKRYGGPMATPRSYGG